MGKSTDAGKSFSKIAKSLHSDHHDVWTSYSARHAAQRFPGKPLAMLWGKPMLQHVWERACQARGLDQVIVATDDVRIESAARAWGATVEMTSSECASGTDRVAEVARRHPEAQIVLNLQGDEPELDAIGVTRLA